MNLLIISGPVQDTVENGGKNSWARRGVMIPSLSDLWLERNRTEHCKDATGIRRKISEKKAALTGRAGRMVEQSLQKENGSVRSINNNERFGCTTNTTIAVWLARIEIEAVSLAERNKCVIAAEFQHTVKNKQEFFTPVVIINNVACLSLLHMDNKWLHVFINFWIRERLVLVADMRNVRSLGNTIAIRFPDDNDTRILPGFLEKVANGNPQCC